MVNHNDSSATCQLCSVCTVTGPSEVGETATLCEVIGDLWSILAQTTRGMAVLANGLGSGHTAPSEAASSVGSIRVAVLTLSALAPRHTASCQPGHDGGHGRTDHQRAREMDSCHTYGQVGQQADKIDL